MPQTFELIEQRFQFDLCVVSQTQAGDRLRKRHALISQGFTYAVLLGERPKVADNVVWGACMALSGMSGRDTP